jgi:hypothetical protein
MKRQAAAIRFFDRVDILEPDRLRERALDDPTACAGSDSPGSPSPSSLSPEWISARRVRGRHRVPRRWRQHRTGKRDVARAIDGAGIGQRLLGVLSGAVAISLCEVDLGRDAQRQPDFDGQEVSRRDGGRPR